MLNGLDIQAMQSMIFIPVKLNLDWNCSSSLAMYFLVLHFVVCNCFFAKIRPHSDINSISLNSFKFVLETWEGFRFAVFLSSHINSPVTL